MSNDAIHHAKKRAMLAAYAEVGTVVRAAEIAGIDRSTHYAWMGSDPAYAEAFAAAGEQAVERLEQEARRRAVEGTEKPVYQGGKLVGTIREYSDTLLIFLLKGALPEKYRERVSADVRGELDVTNRFAEMSDTELDKFARGEGK